ncbi:hypothetical protein MLD38_006399 [Melastoma candidum]|uniref:Uncharacterized protein n=1 Tax=Melastoma candidum TaxID=119954 RepID=A0ACB9RNA8_9MYRT|nr:hypothetical protein MLD38_006399 [Melastoma candidum]
MINCVYSLDAFRVVVLFCCSSWRKIWRFDVVGDSGWLAPIFMLFVVTCDLAVLGCLIPLVPSFPLFFPAKSCITPDILLIATRIARHHVLTSSLVHAQLSEPAVLMISLLRNGANLMLVDVIAVLCGRLPRNVCVGLS